MYPNVTTIHPYQVAVDCVYNVFVPNIHTGIDRTDCAVPELTRFGGKVVDATVFLDYHLKTVSHRYGDF